MSIEQYQFAKLADGEKLAILASNVRGAVGLVSEEAAGLVLGVEPSTLATWRSQSKGPDYVKLGKTIFYTITSLSAWVNGELARQREARRA